MRKHTEVMISEQNDFKTTYGSIYEASYPAIGNGAEEEDNEVQNRVYMIVNKYYLLQEREQTQQLIRSLNLKRDDEQQVFKSQIEEGQLKNQVVLDKLKQLQDLKEKEEDDKRKCLEEEEKEREKRINDEQDQSHKDQVELDLQIEIPDNQSQDSFQSFFNDGQAQNTTRLTVRSRANITFFDERSRIKYFSYMKKNQESLQCKAEVNAEVSNIKSLYEDVPGEVHPLARTQRTKQMKNEGKKLMIEIFGHESLFNNLDLSNVIKYNQYARIQRKIAKKKRLVERHLRENIGNFLASIVGPILFCLNLMESQYVRIISRFLFFVKIAQVFGKVIFNQQMKEIFLKPDQIYLKPEEYTICIILQTYDLLFEIGSLTLVIYLKSLIEMSQAEFDETSGDCSESICQDYQNTFTMAWWTFALLSSFGSFIYGSYLYYRTTQCLDFYQMEDEIDQQELDKIINNGMYDSFRYANVKTQSGRREFRKLSGFEIDQLFGQLAPSYIEKDYIQASRIQNAKRQIRQFEKEFDF